MVTCDVKQLDKVDFCKEDYHRLSPEQHLQLALLDYPYPEHFRPLFLAAPAPASAPFRALAAGTRTQRVLSMDFVVEPDIKFIPEAEFEPKAQRVACFKWIEPPMLMKIVSPKRVIRVTKNVFNLTFTL